MEQSAHQNVQQAKKPGMSRRNMMIYAILVLVVIAGVLYYVVGMNHPVALDGQQVSQADMQGLQSAALNVSLASAVGAGSTANYPVAVTTNAMLAAGSVKLTTNAQGSVTAINANVQPLVINGKPGISYIGAEYCPYCAETRWGMILALMRFGNFTGLKYMSSTSTDVYPNTATFSFINSTYSSSYIAFSSVEIQDRNGSSLQSPTNLENLLGSSFSTGGIPFIDFFNKSVQDGAASSPQVLAGNDWQQAITALNNPNSQVSQAVIGNANVFTAYICQETGASAPVCSMPYIKSIKLN
ncbi:MAG TPA: DUF929 family protein [Candidatus Baltobacteraceae bacterium]|nr:DUF929 family protein [Candidatus Baltobacteraceae bacterium]